MTQRARSAAGTVLAIAAIACAGCGPDPADETPEPLFPAVTEPTQTEPPPLTAGDIAAEEAKQSPKALFSHTCGTCHTLAAAGTSAPIGPDLDRVGRLTTTYVLQRIRSGSLDSSMPADLLVGRSEQRVAAYVARVSKGRGPRRR
ncbi:MAG TPA: c-type cytochrome [Solirubrobacteraceae bacterium]|nr:c-type cytochrome [Solirubrobacteraceae bacterium]